MLNLLVAITIEKFSELQARHMGFNLFLTDQQQAWVDVQRLLLTTRPVRAHVRPAGGSSLRGKAYDTITSRAFQLLMYGVVILNIGFMCMEHYGQGATWDAVLFWSEVAFTAAFVSEAAIQLFALGPKQYFTDSWYVMLFAIAAVGSASVALGASGVASLGLAPLLRVLRVTRFLSILARVEGLHHLVRTLQVALPSIVNVGSVLLL